MAICSQPLILPMVLASTFLAKWSASKYPHLKFQYMSVERLDLPAQKFDFIVLSDLVGYLYDIRLVFERLRSVLSLSNAPRDQVV
jgi:hypothetical protein